MTRWAYRAADVPDNIELLRGLKPNEVEFILAAAKPRRFPAKSVMTYQGDRADCLLLLWKGRARYFFESTGDRKLILKLIKPGDIFGGAALMSHPCNYLVSTEAVRDSIALEWNRVTIRNFARQFPLLVENARIIDMSYVSWYVTAHAALTSLSARERLANVLLELARSAGKTIPDGIELDATNEELADSAVITPYTTSRLMSEWQKSGAIRKRKGKILVRAPEKLLIRHKHTRKSGPRFYDHEDQTN
jgi:CRP-like cAMP-binding protein